jgi:ribosomal protein S18 acetylase RimI-like enzyme
MLAGSDAVVPAITTDGKLVGFVRALSDGAYRSTIFDLIVDPACREGGLGTALVERILATPALEGCRRTDLVCKVEVAPFYESLGFERTSPDQLRMEWSRR